jgi:hypothetical protein
MSIIANLRSWFTPGNGEQSDIQADIKEAEQTPDQSPDCLNCPHRDDEDCLACCQLFQPGEV